MSNHAHSRRTLPIRWHAAPGVLAFLFLLVKTVTSAQTPAARPVINGQSTAITIQHVSVPSSRSFAATVSAFEAQLGTFDPKGAAVSATATTAELAQVRDRIASMAGKSGFMQFDSPRQHGKLLPLVGQPAGKANQYTIGHPLLAVEMTRYNLAAGLYAPLRVLIFEDEHGITHTDYDLPSSLFGQFHDERITKVGLELDQKLAALIMAVSR